MNINTDTMARSKRFLDAETSPKPTVVTIAGAKYIPATYICE